MSVCSNAIANYAQEISFAFREKKFAFKNSFHLDNILLLLLAQPSDANMKYT